VALVETTALPKKPPMTVVSGFILPTNRRCTDSERPENGRVAANGRAGPKPPFMD
jgi:hypothetical protein